MFARLFRNRTAGARENARRRPSANRVSLRVEALEERELMAGGLADLMRADISNVFLDGSIVLAPQPPALSSNPGAGHTLYLDFNGHFEPTWSSDGMSFTNVVTQVFSTDNDLTSFSVSEQSLIREIWARVAEDYAPFDINVTTVEPPSFANGVAMRVSIGANNMGFTNSGYSSINSFNDAQPNVVYVFANNILSWVNGGGVDADGRPYQAGAAIATTASHEAGHSFGLVHQRVFDGQGNVVTNYNPGTDVWTPIMGDNLTSDRTTWSNGITDVYSYEVYGYTVYQPVVSDEMVSLGNVLGYRADDYGDTAGTAQPLTLISPTVISRPSFNISGIVGRMTDADYFSLQVAQAGWVDIKLDVAPKGPNLDSILTLYQWRTTKFGIYSFTSLVQVAQSNPGNLGSGAGAILRLGAQLGLNLGAGSYVITVRSTGEYGSVGQYTLSGSVQGFSPVVGGIDTVLASRVWPTGPESVLPSGPVLGAPSAGASGAAPSPGTAAGALAPARTLRVVDTFALDRLFATKALRSGADLFGLGLEWRF